MRFCGNFHFNSRYCGFKAISGLRFLQPLTCSFCEKNAVVLQARAKCFVLQRIRVHYVTLQFNFNVQCYQNISRVLLTSAFTLLPPCTCGFGIQEKIRCDLRFFGVFLCGFAVFGPPLRPPPIFTPRARLHFTKLSIKKQL